MPTISAACFKEGTEDSQNWEILNQIEASGDEIIAAVQAAQGFQIPPYDFIDLNYVGSTNNLSTVVYKIGGSGGTTVATLTFTYVGGVPTSDDALIDTVTKS